MNIQQIICRIWKEYKPHNPLLQIKINDKHVTILNYLFVIKQFPISYILTAITSSFDLVKKSPNITETEKRQERHYLSQQINIIIKLILQKDLEILLGKQLHSNEFFQTYYTYNNDIEFCKLLFHKEIKKILCLNELQFKDYYVQYRNLIINKLLKDK